MAKGEKKKLGCWGGLCLFFGACVLISLAAVLIPVALGVGAWFLIRFIWRRAVIEDPDNPLVVKGLSLAPIWRKVLAAIPCFLFACCMISSMTSQSQTTEQEPVPATGTAQTAVPATTESTAETDLEVSIIDVGQGDATLVKLPSGKTMLVDAGPDVQASAVENELSKRGIDKIDYLIATHADSDHIAGMSAIVGNHEIGEFLAPQSTHTTDSYLDLLQAVQNKGIATNAAWAGDVIAYGSDFSVKILSPAEGQTYTESNDWSVVLLITYGNTKMLLTGDAPKEVLKGLNVGKIDVLKVSHHGSDTGTDSELISALSPKYALISYGVENEYGHPYQSVLDALSSATVYGTGANGTIRLTSDGSTFTVAPEKNGAVVAPDADATDGAPAEETVQEDSTPAADSAAASQTEQTVVVTPNGSKYHRPGCRTLSRSHSLTEMTEDQAIASGYQPCHVCNP